MSHFELTPAQHAYGDGLLAFIDASPTPIHAAASATRVLVERGFEPVDERNPWPEGPGRYFVTRGASLIAWSVRESHTSSSGFSIIGAHTDSPNLRIKPVPDTSRVGLAQLGVEVYGGVLLNSWLDRDLGLAGSVVVTGASGPERVAFQLTEPLLRVPQLAIHLDREISTNGLLLNKQQHLAPMWAHDTADTPGLRRFLADRLSVDASAIIAFDVQAFDITPSTRLGQDGAFLSAPRIDNLLSCHMAIETLTRVADLGTATIPMIALFDHEEVGSSSATGAASQFLPSVLDRVGVALGGNAEQLGQARARSLLVSADGAHATHPNYPDRHEPQHQVALNGGPVVKINANERYATTADTHAAYVAAAHAVDVPVQHFVTRTDLACGSTIGPLASTATGIAAVDVGAPQLAMHSIRELCGSADPELFHRATLSLLSSR